MCAEAAETPEAAHARAKTNEVKRRTILKCWVRLFGRRSEWAIPCGWRGECKDRKEGWRTKRGSIGEDEDCLVFM